MTQEIIKTMRLIRQLLEQYKNNVPPEELAKALQRVDNILVKLERIATGNDVPCNEFLQEVREIVSSLKKINSPELQAQVTVVLKTITDPVMTNASNAMKKLGELIDQAKDAVKILIVIAIVFCVVSIATQLGSFVERKSSIDGVDMLASFSLTAATWLPGMAFWGSFAGPAYATGICIGSIAAVPAGIVVLGTLAFSLSRPRKQQLQRIIATPERQLE